MMQSVKVIFYGLLITSLLAGCNLGKRTKIESDGQNGTKRIVVNNSNALEMLIGLGAAENIVGVSDMTTKSFVYENQKWTSIGNWQNPNIEAIVNLKPDIIVAYQNWPAAGFEDKLKPFNILVERINCYYMSEYHSDTYRLASLIGKENRADTIIHDFDRIVNMIKDAVADIDVKKRVYMEFSDFTAMGAGTGNNEMLELVNATNIAAKLGIQYPRISTEWLLEENPDVIIKIIATDTITVEMHERLINRAGWNQLDAVKNGQVYLISNELCSSPRAMIGSLFIGKWCYPERFTDINPDSVNAYWLRKYFGITSFDNFIFTLNPRN